MINTFKFKAANAIVLPPKKSKTGSGFFDLAKKHILKSDSKTKEDIAINTDKFLYGK